jgi:RNA polymerase sigma factor (sigma-70 family)
MLTIKESQELMATYFKLRKQYEENKSLKNRLEFERHERLCVEKFQYLITMRTSRYKTFSNYEDLNQEGLEALLKAMKSFNPKKRSLFFWWAHKYIDTRIARSANLHTTIRYPLKVAKETAPHRESMESVIPLLIEETYCPVLQLEKLQTDVCVSDVLKTLKKKEREIIKLAFGLDGDKPMSINKLCKKFRMSRPYCIKTINGALALMRERIKI